MRVHDLAKKLGMSSKDLLSKLHEKNIESKSHMTSLDEDVVKLFLEERATTVKTQVTYVSSSKKTSKLGKKEVSALAPEEAKSEKDDEGKVKTEEIPAIDEESVEAALSPLELSVPISVKDLATKLKEKPSQIIKFLMTKFKIFVHINQSLPEEIAKEVLSTYGFRLVKPLTPEEILAQSFEKVEVKKLESRSPIVTFMGHVDHGKTSLLDAIRRTKVADREHGGITQHIGAYEVVLSKGRITFFDTPGHEAFTAMRARGATVTDIVVLVVAADDGIMPQTIEAYDHAKAAGVCVIVAINKIDKPGIDIEKTKRQLNELGLISEDWGGKTVMVGVSAKTGEGIDGLLDMILLEAELLELKAPYEADACGVVIEAKLSKGRGPVATVLVQQGILKLGDFVLAGHQTGRIRAMSNDHRQAISEAGPAKPAEIIGLSGAPEAGEKFYVIHDEKQAKILMESRQEAIRRQRLEPRAKRLHLEDLYKQIQEGKVQELSMIIKADTQGSVGVIEDSLTRLETQEVKVKIIHKGVGMINTSDVVLATASNAIIIGFHIEPDILAKAMAKKEDIDIRTYRVIYEIISDVRAALEGMLAPRIKKNFLGQAQVTKIFNLSRSGFVAGSIVKKGKLLRGAYAVVVRNGDVVHEGKISILKRFKDDVREVAEGFECGIQLANFTDIKEGDVIDSFELQKIARKL